MNLEIVEPVVKGKAYANKKPDGERPIGDFYGTPRGLVRVLRKEIFNYQSNEKFYDPCAGDGRLIEEMADKFDIEGSDLYTGYGNGKIDFLLDNTPRDIIFTNFPFSEWDIMIKHGLEVANTVITIGRLNYFGTHGRNVSGMWKHCRDVYAFDRMVDYRTPDRKDGFFHVGAMVTGWFIFNKGNHITNMHVLDVSEYATLGAYRGK